MNEQVDQPKEILLEGEILEEYLEDHEKAMTISEQIREEFNDVDPLTMLLDQDLFLKYQWKVMERDAYQTIAMAKLIRYYPILARGEYSFSIENGVYKMVLTHKTLFSNKDEFSEES